MSGPILKEVSDEKIKRILYNNASVLCRSIKPNDKKALVNLLDYAPSIFDADKMESYMREERELVLIKKADIEEITGEDIEFMAQEYSNKFSASGSFDFCIGASVSGSVKADFNTKAESSSNVKFAQVRKVAKFASLNLPSRLTRDKLRALVKPDVLEVIDKCSSEEKAKEIALEWGVAYCQTAILGGTLTMSSKSSSSKYLSANDLKFDVKAEVTYMTGKANAGNEFEMAVQKGKENNSLTVNVTACGGDPSHILMGNEKEWIKSIEENLAVIEFELAPISNLAKEGSKAEALLNKVIGESCKDILKQFKILEITEITDKEYYKNDRMKRFVVKRNVKSIGEYAFRECPNLREVIFEEPSSLVDIGWGAFIKCPKLKDITLPKSLETLGMYAFENCKVLTNVTLSPKMTTIDEGSFSSCSFLTTVEGMHSITTIEEYAFTRCSSLQSIDVNATADINQYAFKYCNATINRKL